MDASLKKIMTHSFAHYIGPGSDEKNRKEFIKHFPEILERYDIKSVNDAGCGDQWIKPLCPEYRGFDIVERDAAIILDITSDVMPKADLIVCRDVLFHLTSNLVIKAINKFVESGSRYLLATSCYDANKKRPIRFESNIAINSRLDLVPIMGEPLSKIEEPFDRRFLGLWKL